MNYDPKAATQRFEAELQRGIKRVMIQMVLADDVVEDEEIQAVQSIYKKITKEEITEDDVYAEIERVKTDGRGIETFLSGLVGDLNDHGKELIVHAAFFKNDLI